MGVASANWLCQQRNYTGWLPATLNIRSSGGINNRRNRAWFPGIAARVGSIPCWHNLPGIFIFFQRKLSCKSRAIERSLSRRERRSSADFRTLTGLGRAAFYPDINPLEEWYSARQPPLLPVPGVVPAPRTPLRCIFHQQQPLKTSHLTWNHPFQSQLN